MPPTIRPCVKRLRTTVEILGPYTHVVFAVGIGSGKFGFPFWNLEPGDWDHVLRVNLTAAANVAHAFSPSLVQARGGTFLFISSISGQIGSQTDPPYSAAKAGLINFAQCAAKDLAPYDVRVNTICPGMVQTALNRSVWKAWNDQQPEAAAAFLRRLGGGEGAESRSAGPLANRRGYRGPRRVSRLSPRTEHHRPDDERRRRPGHALVSGCRPYGFVAWVAARFSR